REKGTRTKKQNEEKTQQARPSGQRSRFGNRRSICASPQTPAAVLLDLAADRLDSPLRSRASGGRPLEGIPTVDARWNARAPATLEAFDRPLRDREQRQEESAQSTAGADGHARTGQIAHALALRSDALENARAGDRAPVACWVARRRPGTDGPRFL